MEHKSQISRKLVLEIMFVQIVRASPFFSPQADILKVVLASFSREKGKERKLILSLHVSHTLGPGQ